MLISYRGQPCPVIWRSSNPADRGIRLRLSRTAHHLRATVVSQASNAAAMCTNEMVDLAQKLADAAGKVTTKYFRSAVDVAAKEDASPVTIADRQAEEAMRAMIADAFPDHGVYGEEFGLEIGVGEGSNFLWVLDPVDGTKSFITGKPLFGTLIALLIDGEPVLGVIDQPVLKERWIGRRGHKSTLNGQEIKTRACAALKDAYMYSTTPHMFRDGTLQAFERVRQQVKVPLYGCDCYAYGLLAAGHVDLVVEADLKPYDYMALVPIIEGAGGTISDWSGKPLAWKVSPDTTDQLKYVPGEVVAAGDKKLHAEALKVLGWGVTPPAN